MRSKLVIPIVMDAKYARNFDKLRILRIRPEEDNEFLLVMSVIKVFETREAVI